YSSYHHYMISLPLSPHLLSSFLPFYFSFFFNHPATTEIYTLSLHDALPISAGLGALRRPRLDAGHDGHRAQPRPQRPDGGGAGVDRKSTRLNSSHSQISYAVFCLKKKKKKKLNKLLYYQL